MSVAFMNAVVARIRARGVVVHFLSGWESRGNGQTSAYQGMIWHHTATPKSANPPSVLWNGRPDLSGPLCNMSGNSDGSVTVIAAHPANHAGASGGRSMGPLPKTGSFNRIVFGLEIVYEGLKPMTDAQYYTACVVGAAVSEVLGRPNADWCRGHKETSITGKIDPGPNVDMNKMRADTVAVMRGGAKVSPASPAPVAKKKVEPMIIRDKLVAGENYGRIVCPVGKGTSDLFGRAWVSMTARNGGNAKYVLFQRDGVGDTAPPGAGPAWGGGFSNADRVWKQVPSGTEFIEYLIVANGPGEISVELEPLS